MVVNIPPDVSALDAGAGNPDGNLPDGALQVRTDFGAPGYGGPLSARRRPHRYLYTIHAVGMEALSVTTDCTPSAPVGQSSVIEHAYHI